jgi:hypothetical protein
MSVEVNIPGGERDRQFPFLFPPPALEAVVTVVELPPAGDVFELPPAGEVVELPPAGEVVEAGYVRAPGWSWGHPGGIRLSKLTRPCCTLRIVYRSEPWPTRLMHFLSQNYLVNSSRHRHTWGWGNSSSSVTPAPDDSRVIRLDCRPLYGHFALVRLVELVARA